METCANAHNSLRPQYLEFTAADEMLALENIDVVRQNGFEIEVDESPVAEDSRRLKLLSIPVSKSTVFDIKGKVCGGRGLHPFPENFQYRFRRDCLPTA